MSAKTISKVKKSICKIQGVNRAYNWTEPYLIDHEYENGGTGFFVDPDVFGSKFKAKKNCRYLLSNFHVVAHYNTSYCILEWPERKKSYMNAKIIHVLPQLDCAILMIDPKETQPRWWLQDHFEFLSQIPNLTLNIKDIIKGESQNVFSVGFPNLQDDYQISQGVMSGRGMGMIQLDISFNGGNSGGPLFIKSKVVGICTASVSESERLGLAIPIQTLARFFQFWAGGYADTILRVPQWGIQYKTLTSDYLKWKKIDTSYTGALIKRVLDDQAACEAGLRENDIITGIESGEKKFKVDNYGNVKVPWCDKRIGIETLEFLLNLDPNDTIIHYIRRKRINQTTIHPQPIHFQVRRMFPSYEPVDYLCLGGMVFQNLNMNILNPILEDDEEEDEVIFDNNILSTIKRNACMKHVVVCTHITPQSYVSMTEGIVENDQILKVNNRKITSLKVLQNVVGDIVAQYYKNKVQYIVIETQNDQHVYSIGKLSQQERADNEKGHVPPNRLHLLVNKKKRGRK